jgi:membrane protease YdiL (CAAX protease family)
VEYVTIDPTPPPPERPELPDGAAPRWPPWYAGVGFLVALVATQIAVVILVVATGTTDSADDDPTFTAAATFVQGMIFIGTAILFASFAGKPTASQFGLRPAKFWPTVKWAAIGLGSFYFLALLYGAIVQPDTEQTVAQDLGANQGTVGQIAAGFMIICIAPIAEEFFFRGFFYRALRSRYSVLVAALIDGLLFGVIHWDFSSASNLLIVPPLAALGFMFCLVYERTGTLYPVIALHALNNAIAFGVTIHDPGVSLVLGPLMLVACTLVPRGQRQRTAMA